MSEVDLGNPNASAGSINIKNIIGNGMTPFISGILNYPYERTSIPYNSTHTVTISALDGLRVLLTTLSTGYTQHGLQKLSVDGVDIIPELTGAEYYFIKSNLSPWVGGELIQRLIGLSQIVGKEIVIRFYNDDTPNFIELGWADVE